MTGGARHGFVGLGVMGEPMASALVRARFDTTVLDLRVDPVQRLVESGAAAATTAGELARAVDIAHVMVVDDAQVVGLLEGSDGVFESMRPGGTVIIHSTIAPDTCRRLAEVARHRGLHLLDAPVAGGVWAAEAGTLTVMVGGDLTVLATARPALEALADRIVHVGGVGSGQAVKIVNNMVAILNRDTLRRAFALAAASGVDRSAALTVMRSGSAGSWAAERYDAFFELAAEHPEGAWHFARVASKDLELAKQLAVGAGLRVDDIDLVLEHVEDLYLPSLAPGGPVAS